MRKLTSLFYFLIIFFIIVNETESRKTPQICSSSCGEIRNISYPYRLKTDPAACGDPDFELSCKNNKTILNFDGGKYYVKRISYDDRAIHVADINLADGSCGLPTKPMSMQEVQMYGRYRGDVDYNYSYVVTYVRCSNNIGGMENSRVPCLNRNESHHVVYVNLSRYSYLSDYDVPKSCNVISTLPVFYEGKIEQNYETALKMQETGFQMRWSVECRDCQVKGRGCVYKGDSTFIFKCEKEYDYYAELLLIFTAFSAMLLAVIIGIFRCILLPLVVFSFILHKYFSTRNKNVHEREHSSETNQKPLTPQRYNYPDILAMSSNFKDKIGQGCSGTVYKGQLPGDSSVAVKMLGSSKLREENFIDEVSRTGAICHPNVVPILGFCYERSKHALVYQYMPNGSLDKHIFSHSLRWEKLHEIALGTARGVEFLHGRRSDAAATASSIVHLDIKPKNIMLDENFNPRVSDFCIAKLYQKKKDFMSLFATGETIGYMAPEVISSEFGAVSCKSDVYSFGMVLLELASGRRNVDVDAITSTKVHFPSWVYELNDRGDLELENLTKTDSVLARKLFIVGLWCTQTQASDRPTMSQVVDMLQRNIDELEMPTKPVFFSVNITVTEPESESPKTKLIPESMESSS